MHDAEPWIDLLKGCGVFLACGRRDLILSAGYEAAVQAQLVILPWKETGRGAAEIFELEKAKGNPLISILEDHGPDGKLTELNRFFRALHAASHVAQ